MMIRYEETTAFVLQVPQTEAVRILGHLEF